MRAVVRWSLAAAFGTFTVAACGDSSGPAGGPVALFTNGTIVDYDTSLSGSEASQLEFTLKSFGLTVRQVVDFDSTALATALSGTGAFVMPERAGNIAPLMTEGAKTVLRRFVDSSGGVLIITPDGAGIDLLDTLFNYALVSGPDTSERITLNAGAAAGTPFSGGPAFIWNNNGTYYFDPTSLPPGGKAIYIDGANPGGAVAYIPQGRGVVVLIGWDWWQAAPHGSQDGGWLEILRRALRS